MKVCKQCGVLKASSAFYKRTAAKDGLQAYCKECKASTHKAYYDDPSNKRKETIRLGQAEKIARNKLYIKKYLKTHHCVDCGNSNPVVLEFDHVRGVKLMAVSKMVKNGTSIETIQAEIDKCQVRCANCHRIVTAQRGGWDKLILDLPQ